MLSPAAPDLPRPILDATAGVVWLLTTLALGVTAWRWARRLFPQDSHLDLTRHTVVLAWGAVVAVATALGGVGALTGTALLSGVALVSAAGLAVLRLRPTAASGSGHDPPPGRVWAYLWLGLVGFWVAHVATAALSGFPDDVDSLAYHIPLVDQWIQSRGLWAAWSNRWASPGNSELLALWAAAPFSGDFFVGLNNLPAAVLLGVSGVAFATRVGLAPGLANLAGLALVCQFVPLKQLTDQMNDVAVAACFFAAMAYVLADHDAPGVANRVLGAVSLGLLAGIKYYALGYAGLVFLIWVGLALAAHGRRAAGRAFAAGAVGVLVFGGFWYVRNWVATGTPLYPTGSGLPSLYPDLSRTSFFGNRRAELLPLFADAVWHRAGPCHLIGLLAAPVSLGWLLRAAVGAVRRGDDPHGARVRAALGALLAGTGVLLGVTPMAVEDNPGTLNQLRGQYCPVRYGLCFLCTATVASLVVLQRVTDPGAGPGRPTSPVRSRWRSAVGFGASPTLFVLISAQVVLADKKLEIRWADTLLLTANLLLLTALWAVLTSRWPRVAVVTGLIGASGAWAGVCVYSSERWHGDFDTHYASQKPFMGLPSYANTPGQRRATLMLQPLCYPYLGSGREHRLYQPAHIPSAEWLADYIDANRITLVYVGAKPTATSLRRWFPAVTECLAHYPSRFRRVDEGSWGVLFQVVPERVEVGGSPLPRAELGPPRPRPFLFHPPSLKCRPHRRRGCLAGGGIGRPVSEEARCVRAGPAVS